MPHQGPPASSIEGMFAKVSPTYDVLNRVLSLGVDAHWRGRASRAVARSGARRVLDVATGTGALAARLVRDLGAGAQVTGVDFCTPLLDIARGRHEGITFVHGDALALAFPDASFDAATIAFGIRNTADPVQALREMARVVKPGGLVVVLEFGQPTGALRPLFSLYTRAVMVPLGGLLSGQPSAYRYLVESSARFPAGAAFEELLREADCFSSLESEPLTEGIAFLYRGTVRADRRSNA
jgi:demethylmenaquinone methyltransferase/2-methoxy-6-polyprenyl-1,4-benzoquinol methylase